MPFRVADYLINAGYQIEQSTLDPTWFMVTLNGIPMSHYMHRDTAEWMVFDPNARAFHGPPYPEGLE